MIILILVIIDGISDFKSTLCVFIRIISNEEIKLQMKKEKSFSKKLNDEFIELIKRCVELKNLIDELSKNTEFTALSLWNCDRYELKHKLTYTLSSMTNEHFKTILTLENNKQ